MKQTLLSFLFIVFCFVHINAQTVEVIGKGIKDQNNANLTVSDLSGIEKIDVGVIKSWGPVITPGDVTFSNYMGNGNTTLHSDIINKSTINPVPGQYLTSSFDEIDGSGINVSIINDANDFSNFIQSFYGFVYRNKQTLLYKSFSSLETVYFYQNGSQDPYMYTIPIETSSSSRDIVVQIPVSELADDQRPVIIDIIAGGQNVHQEINTYNLGDSFYLGRYTLTAVSGDVNEILVKIYSPRNSTDQQNGDSFYVNGVVVDVEKEFDGCTYTQGYWKNHSTCKENRNGKGPKRDDTWDNLPEGEDTIFFLSEQNYCEVYDTKPGKGGKYYILAHQYIAAQLNLYNDADPTDIVEAFDEATEFLNTYTPQEIKGNKQLEAKCVELGGILDEFNNGVIGPGHCDDDDDDQASITPIKQPVQKISVYPNPASTVGKIAFTPKQAGEVSVDLYNLSGQKVSTVFSGKSKINHQMLIEFDTSPLMKGLYIAVIKNGSDTYKEKISVIK